MSENSRPAQVVVHYGMPKTGTSSIQESLFRRLSDPRFYYLKLGRSNASIPIATAFKGDAADFHFHVKSGTSADALRKHRAGVLENLDAELKLAGERTPILSGEAISGLKESEFRQLCGALTRQRKAAVTAVGYVRRPKEYMESTFQQRVKSGEPGFDMPRVFPRYRARFAKFDAALGKENVGIWLFDPSRFRDKCVVQDFCARLGIQFRAQDVTRTNEALSLPALSLLYAYRKFGPGYGVGPNVIEENRRLIRHVRSLGGLKLRLHSSLVAPVIEARREEIEWMEARLGASLAEDISANDAEAIRSEEDLLKFTPDTLRWLAGELGEEHAGQWRPDMSPLEVAQWMHLLRIRLGAGDRKPRQSAAKSIPPGRHSADPNGQGDPRMNLKDMVQSARQAAPNLEKVSDDDAQKLVREVFRHIRREITATPEGKVEIDGLGLFRVRQAERKKEGRKVRIKKVIFRAEKEKPSE